MYLQNAPAIGEPFGLRVRMKSALLCSAHRQNGLSRGLGEISTDYRTLTSSLFADTRHRAESNHRSQKTTFHSVTYRLQLNP